MFFVCRQQHIEQPANSRHVSCTQNLFASITMSLSSNATIADKQSWKPSYLNIAMILKRQIKQHQLIPRYPTQLNFEQDIMDSSPISNEFLPAAWRFRPGPEDFRRLYRVKLRHSNCRKPAEDGKVGGFCEYITEWALKPERSPGECCSPGSESIAELNATQKATERLMEELTIFASGISEYECIRGADIFDMFIVWNNSAPSTRHTFTQGLHNSVIKPRHLELITQRKAGDYIQIHFETPNVSDDEDERREKMYKALGKLARKASSHCNR
ncbi:hypothetical protein F5Y14DRAFT_409357 [Nemania sp. NC0429]|nr:hypothetical protein F5Y14DRAFT_409357 [Nemania sp. NC0429]